MTILSHIYDKAWILQRKKLWERRKEDFWDEGEVMIATHKKFFFDGDFDSYITNIPELRFSTVYDSYPAMTLVELQHIIKCYWQFAHESKNPWYLTFDQRTKDDVFNGNFSRLRGDIRFHPAELMSKTFLWLYGDTYQSPRFLDIRLDYWQPKIEIEAWRMASSLKGGMARYLFEEDNDYTHYKAFINYFLSVLPMLEIGCFDTVYAEPHVRNMLGGKLYAGQEITREFFMQLYGYGDEDTVHNSPEDELYIKEAIENLDMPAEFYPFIDFIHKYKQDAIDISE